MFHSDLINQVRGSRADEIESPLGAAIDRAEPIPPNSADEVAIRAATVVAGAVLTSALRARGGVASDLTTAQLDYYLWKTAVARDAAGELPPFHRTRCTAY